MFKPGDKVECIKEPLVPNCLTVGNIYTVEFYRPGINAIALIEAPDGLYGAHRFIIHEEQPKYTEFLNALEAI